MGERNIERMTVWEREKEIIEKDSETRWEREREMG